MNMTRIQLNNDAKEKILIAFKIQFGFAPKKKDIIFLETSENSNEIISGSFEIGEIEYYWDGLRIRKKED